MIALAVVGYFAYRAMAAPAGCSRCPIRATSTSRRAEKPHVPYNSDPPTSGPHLPYIAPWGVHTRRSSRSSRCTISRTAACGAVQAPVRCPDLVGAPRDRRGATRTTCSSPLPGPETRIALTAWTRLDNLDEFDESPRLALHQGVPRDRPPRGLRHEAASSVMRGPQVAWRSSSWRAGSGSCRSGLRRVIVSPLAVPPYRSRSTRPTTPCGGRWSARSCGERADPVVARDSGVIASEDVVVDDRVYADCGRFGDVRVEGDAQIAFTVFVARRDREHPDAVQVNTQMRTQTYRRGRGPPRPGPPTRAPPPAAGRPTCGHRAHLVKSSPRAARFPS